VKKILLTIFFIMNIRSCLTFTGITVGASMFAVGAIAGTTVIMASMMAVGGLMFLGGCVGCCTDNRPQRDNRPQIAEEDEEPMRQENQGLQRQRGNDVELEVIEESAVGPERSTLESRLGIGPEESRLEAEESRVGPEEESILRAEESTIGVGPEIREATAIPFASPIQNLMPIMSV
jgi:hypothetical protein